MKIRGFPTTKQLLDKSQVSYNSTQFDTIPSGSNSKEFACKVGDQGSVPDQEAPLEKKMATHSSILAWKIQWTEEPGGLESMKSQGVRHNWVTNTFTFTWR